MFVQSYVVTMLSSSVFITTKTQRQKFLLFQYLGERDLLGVGFFIARFINCKQIWYDTAVINIIIMKTA